MGKAKVRIKCIDTFSTSTHHEQFNASLLLILTLIYDNITYYVDKSSYKRIDDLLENGLLNNVKKKYVFVVHGNSRMILLLRYLCSAFLNIWLLLTSSKGDVLIYNFNNLFSLHLLFGLNYFLKRKILVFCHSEMELLVSDPSKGGRLHKVLSLLVRSFFLKSNRRMQEGYFYFAVLGESIKKNLAFLLSSKIMEMFITVDHGYIFNKKCFPISNSNILPISLGTVGAFNLIKGATSMVEFASMLKKQNVNNVSLSITGRISYDVQILKENGIDIPKNEGRAALSFQEFNKRIESLDYILFFYPTDSYRLTASGAIMDAINHKKNIIAIHNEYFAYLFDKYGAFGYLVKDLNEMVGVIKHLVNYGNLHNVYDFDLLQKKMSPQRLQCDVKKELLRIGYL